MTSWLVEDDKKTMCVCVEAASEEEALAQVEGGTKATDVAVVASKTEPAPAPKEPEKPAVEPEKE